MWPAFPASDYYEGSVPRSALAAGWPTPLPESRTWFPSSRRLRLHSALGSAFTPGTAPCRARHRETAGCTECGVPVPNGLSPQWLDGYPMTLPSPYRGRAVSDSTLQTAVSFVTVAELWLGAHSLVGLLPPRCQEGFKHGSASGPRACFRSHRPTPGRIPSLEISTYALLGAQPPLAWAASLMFFPLVAWKELLGIGVGRVVGPAGGRGQPAGTGLAEVAVPPDGRGVGQHVHASTVSG